MSKAIKAIKAMTEAELNELRMLLVTGSPTVVETAKPPAANLAIPAEARQALVNEFVASNDDVSRNAGFRAAVLKFGEAIPAEYHGKVLPKADAEAMADAASAKFQASYGDLSSATDERKKSVARMVAQKKSRALSLFTCSAILPVAYAQGFTGTIQETLKLCTKLKENSFDLPKVMALIAVEPVKDPNADVARYAASILNVKADNLGAASAKAKAQLVAWCDYWNVKAKHADEYRNPQIV